jgi:ATP-dependent RNA helicase RhlE
MSFFDDLGLAQPILKALAASGYDTPTPIQMQAIPALLEGRDLCGIAQTGTGKTAAFALPSLHRFATDIKPRPQGGCRMLVLSPTRELAAQIADKFRDYGKFLGLNIQCVFGGMPIYSQKKKLAAGADILVATPGRLLDLIEQRALSLKDVEIFVLDEADQMMDLGFIHALKRIDQLLPKQRQSLFFSATMPKAIAELGSRFLNNPVRVSVTPAATTAERVEQHVTFVNQGEKQALLNHRLKDESVDRALVFSRTKHGADRIVRHLAGAGIKAAAIHGNKSQGQRTAALQGFRAGSIRILVATDIAARGIDVPGVSHVFNYELPNVPDQYVHRIGRTARAGADGIAVSFVAPDERGYLKDIERLTKIKLMQIGLPEGFRQMVTEMPKPVSEPRAEQARGGRPGGREGGRPGGRTGSVAARSGPRGARRHG